MNKFSFITDAESESFCLMIAEEMMRIGGITEAEAIGRINRQWQGIDFIGSTDITYHRNPEHWAKTIFYTDDTLWWLDWWMKNNKPKVKPYP